MINQVDFEGYLTRAWEYREQRFMRLANHRPGEEGQTSNDYITVLIDSALDFDPRRVKVGRRLRVRGRIVGRVCRRPRGGPDRFPGEEQRRGPEEREERVGRHDQTVAHEGGDLLVVLDDQDVHVGSQRGWLMVGR